MKNYFAQNKKMKNSSVKIFNFGIPAYRSQSGFVTCPMAGTCKAGCYARQGAYVWSNVSQAYEKRLALTKSSDFVERLSSEIQKRKIQFVRIHDSGDFYSPKYMQDWFKIARLNPLVRFYAYTKMIKMFQANLLFIPLNLTIIFSEGGKQDSLIDRDKDRHSRVFDSIDSLSGSNYADVTHDDARAFDASNKLIGLVYHGAKSKGWSTHVN